MAVITSRVKAVLAHASCGRASSRRLPDRVRDRILHLARTTYAGFNDHRLCEKLIGKEGVSIGRETLRRLLRSAGIGSSRQRRAPTHRQRRRARAREGEMVPLDASLHRWLEDRGLQLTLLGFLDDATRKVLVAEFFPTEDARGYFRLLQRLLFRASRSLDRKTSPPGTVSAAIPGCRYCRSPTAIGIKWQRRRVDDGFPATICLQNEFERKMSAAGFLRRYRYEADGERLAAYPFYFATLGELEFRRRRHATAREHFRSALALARNPMERRLLNRPVSACKRGDLQ